MASAREGWKPTLLELIKSVWRELHPHLSGYEPGALTVKRLTERKWVGYPGAAPGASCLQNKRVRWLSRIRLKMDACPRLALGKAALQATDSALCLARGWGVSVIG